MSDEQKDDPAATMQHKVVAKIMPLGEPEPPRPSAGPDVSAFDAVPARGVSCLRCGQLMVDCEVMANHYVRFIAKDNALFNVRSTTASARVCPNCGYAEMYADYPNNLLPRR